LWKLFFLDPFPFPPQGVPTMSAPLIFFPYQPAPKKVSHLIHILFFFFYSLFVPPIFVSPDFHPRKCNSFFPLPPPLNFLFGSHALLLHGFSRLLEGSVCHRLLAGDVNPPQPFSISGIPEDSPPSPTRGFLSCPCDSRTPRYNASSQLCRSLSRYRVSTSPEEPFPQSFPSSFFSFQPHSFLSPLLFNKTFLPHTFPDFVVVRYTTPSPRALSQTSWTCHPKNTPPEYPRCSAPRECTHTGPSSGTVFAGHISAPKFMVLLTESSALLTSNTFARKSNLAHLLRGASPTETTRPLLGQGGPQVRYPQRNTSSDPSGFCCSLCQPSPVLVFGGVVLFSGLTVFALP